MLLIVLAAAVGTWMLRVAFITLVPAEHLPARIRRALDDAGPVVLAAMVAQATVAGHGAGLRLGPMALGGAAAALVAWRTSSLVVTVVTGIAVYAAAACSDARRGVIVDRTEEAPSTAWPAGPPAVGARAARQREVGADDIERFTALSGDRNPIHYDEEVAAATVFGGIVVQGGVTTAILNAVVAEDLPGPGTVFLHTDWSYRAPVRPGDTITGSVEVSHVRTDKPITELVTRVTRDDGTVCVEGTATCFTVPIVPRG